MFKYAEKIALPLSTPVLKSYPIYGFLTSIISSEISYQEWFYNNFIQLRYLKNDHIVFFEQYRSLLRSCPYISEEIFTRETVENYDEGPIGFLIDCIKNKKYVFLYCDRYYLRAFNAFQTYHITHELFIYGYDGIEEKFLCMDNDDRGIFTEINVSLDEMLEAFSIQEDISFFRDIHVIRKDEWWGIEAIDERNIITLYLEYTNSVYRRNICEPFSAVNYGFDIHYDVLKDLILYMEQNSLDIRSVFVLTEHKLLMSKRFMLLYDKTNKDIYLKLAEGYKKLALEYNSLKIMLLKANSQGKEASWIKSINSYQQLIDEERNLFKQFRLE